MSEILVLVLVAIGGVTAWCHRRVWLDTGRDVWAGLYPRKALPVRRLPTLLYRTAERTHLVGVSGRRRLPEVIEVRAHPDDLAPIASAIDWFAGDITAVLMERAKASGWDVPADFVVKVIGDAARPVGVPRGFALFNAKVRPGTPEGTTCSTDGRRSIRFTTRPCPPTRGPGWAEARTQIISGPATESAGLLEVQVGERAAELIAVTAAGITIGRSHDADIQVDASGASRRHARLTLNDTGLVVADLGSLNGTRLEGTKLTRATTAGKAALLDVGGTAVTIKVQERPLPPPQGQVGGTSNLGT